MIATSNLILYAKIITLHWFTVSIKIIVYFIGMPQSSWLVSIATLKHKNRNKCYIIIRVLLISQVTMQTLATSVTPQSYCWPGFQPKTAFCETDCGHSINVIGREPLNGYDSLIELIFSSHSSIQHSTEKQSGFLALSWSISAQTLSPFASLREHLWNRPPISAFKPKAKSCTHQARINNITIVFFLITKVIY